VSLGRHAARRRSAVGGDNTSRTSGNRIEGEETASPISIKKAQSSCREEGNEKTHVTNSSVRLDRRDSGLACLFGAAAQAQQPICSAWLIESSRFMNVPSGR